MSNICCTTHIAEEIRLRGAAVYGGHMYDLVILLVIMLLVSLPITMLKGMSKVIFHQLYCQKGNGLKI
jgi:hypothetical protein